MLLRWLMHKASAQSFRAPLPAARCCLRDLAQSCGQVPRDGSTPPLSVTDFVASSAPQQYDRASYSTSHGSLMSKMATVPHRSLHNLSIAHLTDMLMGAKSA